MIQAVVIVLGYPPELDGKTLLLNVWHHVLWLQDWRDPESWNWARSFLSAGVFVAPAGAVYVGYWERKLLSCFPYGPCELLNQPSRQDVSTSAIV